MPFTLIAGRFHVTNYSPDGDSIRFEPSDPTLLTQLSGPPAKKNGRGHVQLRIEAIDTLETHYSPPSGGGVYHQPLAGAQGAADALMDFLGITNVQWDSGHKTVLSANDAVPGYILSRAVEKNGRPVAFVFAGASPEADGASVRLEPDRLKTSYNYEAVVQGLGYATFYEGLFHDLRDTMVAGVAAARAAGAGIYATDATTTGVDIDELSAITEDFPIMPKLYRRLVEYFAFYGSVDGFKAKMQQYAEPVLDLTTSNFTHFDTFIEQADGSSRIRLTQAPETLVFNEMPQRPPETFSMLMGDAVTHLE